MTRIYPIHSDEGLALAVDYLQRGEVIAVPTDTVYGLIAPAFSEEAVAKIYQIKQRPLNMSLPIFIKSTQNIEQICQNVPDIAWRIAEEFWPGALTLILNSVPSIPSIVNSSGNTIGIRIPAHPLIPKIIDLVGQPLASTSANLSGMATPLTAQGIKEQLEGRVPLILDGGKSGSNIGSTILDLTENPPRIIRQGAVTIPLRYLQSS